MKRLLNHIRRNPGEALLLFLFVAGVCGVINCNVPNEKAPTGADESPGQNALYPHPEGWSRWTVHGRFVVENGAPGCEQCHGADYRGGTSGVGCFDCHDYPHAANWAAPKEHGMQVIQEGKEGCATICHGADFTGGDAGASCYSCHAFYPHPNTWQVTHKDAVEDEDEKNCATLCHGTDLDGGDSGVACSDCHGSEDD